MRAIWVFHAIILVGKIYFKEQHRDGKDKKYYPFTEKFVKKGSKTNNLKKFFLLRGIVE
jgi:hypothetical protein